MGSLVPGPGHPDFCHPVTGKAINSNKDEAWRALKEMKRSLAFIEEVYPRNVTEERLVMYREAIIAIESLIKAKGDLPQDPLVV